MSPDGASCTLKRILRQRVHTVVPIQLIFAVAEIIFNGPAGDENRGLASCGEGGGHLGSSSRSHQRIQRLPHQNRRPGNITAGDGGQIVVGGGVIGVDIFITVLGQQAPLDAAVGLQEGGEGGGGRAGSSGDVCGRPCQIHLHEYSAY